MNLYVKIPGTCMERMLHSLGTMNESQWGKFKFDESDKKEIKHFKFDKLHCS